MSNKHTFWSLLNTYEKIEVPIIQRDYAQGRKSSDVNTLRDKFINNFLIASIVRDEAIELDFVYGSILIETKNEKNQKTFIPLDGQQRLTTLFLLYYFIAVKENRLEEVREKLLKFTYETRPSAHDFCKKLLENSEIEDVLNIKSELKDAVWFNEDWKNDPTVSGMLNMLDTFAKNSDLVNPEIQLLDKIKDDKNQLISFYFTDLDEFGLTENLYIRMNARGKMLTDFENFKSEFSKIIRYNHQVLEDVKNKIEYSWVDNLWDYREKDSYIVDTPFMNYLSFITEMLYYKSAELRSEKPYESNFLDLRVLNGIYSNEENLKFLVFALDFIHELKLYNKAVLWEGESLHQILKNILSNKRDINQMFILYEAVVYRFENKPKENMFDFIRVVRNLIANTDDNSRREWPRLITSLYNLVSDENVYEVLSKISDDNKLIGFNVEQRKEEIFKANLILTFNESKSSIFEIDDNKSLLGRLKNILIVPFASNDDSDFKIELESLEYNAEKLLELGEIFKCYKEISKNEFNDVWGNLINTSLYTQTYDSRLIYSGNYKRHPAIILFAKKYYLSKLDLSEFVIKTQKQFVLSVADKYDDFSTINNVKEQLSIYYIINERIYLQPFVSFFKNNNFNFGWLSKETGYKSNFKSGIEGCRYFPTSNPVFQTYNYQFRYNLGLNRNNTLDLEIVGGSKKRDPFSLVEQWAKAQN